MARENDLTVSEIEGWIEEAQRNMENGFRTRPKDLREQYESELRETKEPLGEARLQIYALKSSSTCWTRTRTHKVVAGGTGPRRAQRVVRKAMSVVRVSPSLSVLQADCAVS
jgi:hypothetical protein